MSIYHEQCEELRETIKSMRSDLKKISTLSKTSLRVKIIFYEKIYKKYKGNPDQVISGLVMPFRDVLWELKSREKEIY